MKRNDSVTVTRVVLFFDTARCPHPTAETRAGDVIGGRVFLSRKSGARAVGLFGFSSIGVSDDLLKSFLVRMGRQSRSWG